MRAVSSYRQALAAQDCVALYLNTLAAVLLLLTGCAREKGWHRVIDLPLVVPMISAVLYACFVRTVELRWPAFYERWRPVLVRGERYYMLLLFTGDCMLVGQLQAGGALTPARVGRAFTYHHWQASPTWNTCRMLNLLVGGFFAIPTWVRLLPFPEQLAHQAIFIADLLLFAAEPAAKVMSAPQAREGNRHLCQLLIGLPYSDTWYSGVCDDPATPLRLVMFAIIYLWFFIPLVLSFRHYQRLHRLQQLDWLRRYALDNGIEYQPPAEVPWWKEGAATVGVLLYLALVSWRFLLDYDHHHLLAAIARGQEWALPATAEIWPYLSMRPTRW